MIKVLIVEDEPIIAEDIRDLLTSNDFQVVGIAHKAEDALDMLHNRKPDFAMLDINLKGQKTGIDVAEYIHENYHIPYIFLTSFDDEATFNEAQQYAPYGYLVKPFQDRTLLASVKLALANFKNFQRKGELSKEVIEKKLKGNVTQQEFAIIKSLHAARSYKQIAAEHFISINTVKFHTKNIYSKFGLTGRSELAATLSA